MHSLGGEGSCVNIHKSQIYVQCSQIEVSLTRPYTGAGLQVLRRLVLRKWSAIRDGSPDRLDNVVNASAQSRAKRPDTPTDSRAHMVGASGDVAWHVQPKKAWRCKRRARWRASRRNQDLTGAREPTPFGVCIVVQVPFGTYFQALP